MLIAYRAIWVAPVALFFSALNIGSIQLPIALKLDSTLSGVLQGALVLLVLLVEGGRQMYLRRARLRADDPGPTGTGDGSGSDGKALPTESPVLMEESDFVTAAAHPAPRPALGAAVVEEA